LSPILPVLGATSQLVSAAEYTSRARAKRGHRTVFEMQLATDGLAMRERVDRARSGI
jgi:hypothetical protein